MFNHAVSAKKFRIIEDILRLGWSVLLSDIDVLVLKVADSAQHTNEVTIGNPANM